MDEATELVALLRVGWVDDTVACFSTSLLPSHLVPGLVDTPPEGSLYAALRSTYGLDPVRRWSRAALEVPDDSAATWLSLRHRAPMWLVEGVNTCSRLHQPIEVVRSWMRTDVIKVLFELGEVR